MNPINFEGELILEYEDEYPDEFQDEDDEWEWECQCPDFCLMPFPHMRCECYKDAADNT